MAPSAQLENAVIIPPVYIGEHVRIANSVIGPHVSIGNNTNVYNSVVSNSIIQEDTSLKNGNVANSMLGNFVVFEGRQSDLSLGDYNTLIE